jgi:hypothetical protein
MPGLPADWLPAAAGRGPADLEEEERDVLPVASWFAGRVRIRSPHLYAVGWMALALLVAGCGSGAAGVAHSTPGQSLFGPFAGYTWHGNVRSVSAAVVVPRIVDGSGNGYGGTWIGAEGAISSRTNSAPFVQVGVNEARGPSSARGPDRDAYFVFWSDTAVGFHPRPLLTVKAGDTVKLSMVLTSGRWSLRATDATTHSVKTLSVPEDGRSFSQAIWTQEDISSQKTSGQLPYPELGAIDFTSVEVDATHPSSRALAPTWMSTGEGTFGPATFAAGAFSIKREHPSAAAVHYQRIVVTEDLQADLFNSAAGRLSARTGAEAFRAECLVFARALKRNADSLAAYPWSARVKPLIAKLIAATERTRRTVLHLAAGPTPDQRQVLAAFRPAAMQHEISLRIKAILGLPVTSLSGVAVARYVSTNAT